MDGDSSANVHVVPLVLIIIILAFILCIRPPVILPRTDRAATSGGLEVQCETHEEQEPLLSHVEAHGSSLTQYDLLRGTRDTRPTGDNCQWKRVDAEEIEIAHQRIAELKKDLSTSVSENAELQRRCDALSQELDGTRLFLNTADPFADSEIIQLLQKLNAELQHVSTFIADHVVSVFGLDAMTSGSEHQIVVDRVSQSIGSTLVQFLRNARRDNPEIPMYLQVAFQAYLAYHLCQIVSSWALDEGHSVFINDIYQKLRETEKPTISGRWRSLTRLYAFPTCVGEPNALVTPIIAGLSCNLLAVGCTATHSDVMSELSSKFEKKILAIIALAAHLNQMIGAVVSGDFEVFVVRPGDTFDGGSMEKDTDGDGDNVQVAPSGTEAAQNVLCTSEIGLTKRMHPGTGERVTKMVIKAKVFLESFLDSEN